MKAVFTYKFFKIIVPAMFLLTVFGGTAAAQNARLDFDNLKNLEDRAVDVVEVNIDGNLLNLAKRVLIKTNEEDAKKIGEAIKGLEGIYVRVYRFENLNEYNQGDVEAIRTQLRTPGWDKLANVRSRKNNQKVDVYTMFQGERMSGVAVLISEDKSIALVNVIGQIDIDLLVELGGKLNIPAIDIEKNVDKNDDKNEQKKDKQDKK